MIIILISFLTIITIGACEHLILGSVNNNNQLMYHTVAEYSSIPLMKRVKQVFYTSPDQKVINVSTKLSLSLLTTTMRK